MRSIAWHVSPSRIASFTPATGSISFCWLPSGPASWPTGSEPLIPKENDKCTVVALREIAAGLIGYDTIPEIELEEEDTTKALERALAQEFAAEMPLRDKDDE